MFKSSIASYPERGNYGQSNYRGNCSGYIIKDFLEYVGAEKQQLFCDPSMGGGTSRDVAKEKGMNFAGYDLHSGFNLLKHDLGQQFEKDHGRRADHIFWHPPYHGLITYSGAVWGTEPHPDDLSRCENVAEFMEKLHLALMNIYDGLQTGGYYAVLMGNQRRKGTYLPLAAMMQQLCPGKLREELVKVQHNMLSQDKFYSGGQRWVPMAHELLYIFEKDRVVFSVEHGLWLDGELERLREKTWKNTVKRALMQAGRALSLNEIYEAVAGCALVAKNQNWEAKVRQKLQDAGTFLRVERGVYALA